ncbi:hypothetical protein EMQ25_08870 [Arsenicitalea aurantiaca]|uniref:FAD-binding oxidoreductase n=1 Tax=Arsenicitalea aurantiaca TaxID=1783274 RepID=A0A433XAA0_9HYPH|nr:hypothetical protein [Arsenicitalea aurantiaca]RUT30982.1 hypothetical protein EMQ25_08870 [Arsenicitalea aurantiaca]
MSVISPAPYDFAVFGSSPLARLLAGLLAHEHGQRACLVGESHGAFRLTRGIDLSVAPLTRPETWSVLRRGSVETEKLLLRIAPRGLERADPLFVAETAPAREALAHVRHMAMGYGYAVERVGEGIVAPGATALRIRDALTLNRPLLETALDPWLKSAGVRWIDPHDGEPVIKRDGSVRFGSGGSSLEAAHAILVDDAPIIAHLPADERARLLTVHSTTTLLTEPAAPLAAPIMDFLDRGVRLSQRPRRGIAALASGPADEAIARIGASLSHLGRLRRAGQAVFQTVETRDGAPLVGPARGLRATLVTGLGPIGVFLAPSLARFIAGKPSVEEAAYFGPREPGRFHQRALVADYQGPIAAEAALEAVS